MPPSWHACVCMPPAFSIPSTSPIVENGGWPSPTISWNSASLLATPPRPDQGCHAAARLVYESPPAAQYRLAIPAATSPAMNCTFIISAAVYGLPTPATSYWKMPTPGVQ